LQSLAQDRNTDVTNAFYNASGNPATGAQGLSALMRAEFAAIGIAFDLVPQISTTGDFSTVFNQQGNFTFTLPGAPGTLAMLSDVATETTRATTAEGVIATAVATETTRATAAEALLAPLASPALTGTPTAPTPTLGDASTKIATMAALRAAIGGFAGFAGYPASTVLTNAVANFGVQSVGAAAITLTLPLSASVPMGATITFFNHGTGQTTIVPQGTDFLFDANGESFAGVLQPGDNLTVFSRSSVEWDIIGGTASLQFVNGPKILNAQLIGTPVAPTPAPGDTTTKVATMAAVSTAVLAAETALFSAVHDVTASRALNTTYTNSIGRPVFLSIIFQVTEGPGTATLSVNGVLVSETTLSGTGQIFTLNAMVPNGGTYSFNSSFIPTINGWTETW
jgi:hypothetical protein